MILYKSDNYIVRSFIEVDHGVGPLNGNKDFIVRYNIPSMQNNQKVYFSSHSSLLALLPPFFFFLLFLLSCCLFPSPFSLTIFSLSFFLFYRFPFAHACVVLISLLLVAPFSCFLWPYPILPILLPSSFICFLAIKWARKNRFGKMTADF